MQSMRVAAVSMNAPLDRLSGLLEEVDVWCRRGADQGAELVLFP